MMHTSNKQSNIDTFVCIKSKQIYFSSHCKYNNHKLIDNTFSKYRSRKTYSTTLKCKVEIW